MPGPGTHKKRRSKHAKPKPKAVVIILNRNKVAASNLASSTLSISESVANDINGAAAESWTRTADWISEVCQLPDLDTNKGLKKVYNDFDSYYGWLESLYNQVHRYPMIQVGVIAIFAKMCKDNLLMDKLIEQGFLGRIFRLLSEPRFQQVALYSLRIMTQHEVLPPRLVVAMKSLDLIQILEENPSSTVLADLIVPIIAVAFCTTEGKDENHKHRRLYHGSLTVPGATRILKAMTAVASNPRASPSLAARCLKVIEVLASDITLAFDHAPDAVKLLLAGLSSKDWGRRIGCLYALLELYSPENSTHHPLIGPSTAPAPTLRNLLYRVNLARANYGQERCHSFIADVCFNELISAFTVAVLEGDIYSLGLSLSKNLLQTDYIIAEKAYADVQTSEPAAVKRFTSSHPGRFISCLDFFPLCSRALRAKNEPHSRSAANLLDITRLFIEKKFEEAGDMATKAIDHTPEFTAYWYYIISSSVGQVKGLKAAKLGRKCPKLTPYLQHMLLERAVEQAWFTGFDILNTAVEVGDSRWYEAMAYLHSALADATAYIEEAPPDATGMEIVVNWYVILTVTLTDVDPELQIFENALKKLRVKEDLEELEQMLTHRWADDPQKLHRTHFRQIILEHYQESYERFSHVIEKSNRMEDTSKKTSHDCIALEESQDQLAVWLNGVDLEEQPLTDDGAMPRPKKMYEEKIFTLDEERLTLTRCGWCSNPSASLKKCRGCTKVRYCDSTCQKCDWNTHKLVCKPDVD
ncbi:hypothetical protein NP233_g3869 [Leucocoprinus birnbaumii]|uniref:MYND-type domain-containing protein n=1 Tax=Leucocoprinus birnbaumii TaxID=56174 RepID=A0AAD5VVP7_9AGAR|nr:hypothetical protein NP233_g3869 [Leucocoprinus birnbaumii]